MKIIDQQLMKHLKSNLILLISFVLTSNLSFSNLIVKDTTIFFFIEDCSDSSLNNCWYARDNHEGVFWGGYEYDFVKKRVKYERGFYVIGDARIVSLVDSTEISQMKYLDYELKIEDFQFNSIRLYGMAVEFLGLKIYNQVNFMDNYYYNFLDKTNKKIQKKHKKIKRMYTHNFDKKPGSNYGKLFLIKLTYIEDNKNQYAERQVLNIDERGMLKRPYVKTITTKAKFVLKIDNMMFIPPLPHD